MAAGPPLRRLPRFLDFSDRLAWIRIVNLRVEYVPSCRAGHLASEVQRLNWRELHFGEAGRINAIRMSAPCQ